MRQLNPAVRPCANGRDATDVALVRLNLRNPLLEVDCEAPVAEPALVPQGIIMVIVRPATRPTGLNHGDDRRKTYAQSESWRTRRPRKLVSERASVEPRPAVETRTAESNHQEASSEENLSACDQTACRRHSERNRSQMSSTKGHLFATSAWRDPLVLGEKRPGALSP